MINDARLSLGDGGKMKLDTDPFPVSMVELEHKKILVCTDQAETTKRKSVINFWQSSQLDDQAPQPKDWRVEGECPEEVDQVGKTHIGYADWKISAAVGGKPKISGHPRDQTGQIHRGPEQIWSARDEVWWGAPEKDGATLYRSRIRDKAKSPVYWSVGFG
jgi:hypothetical protein